MNTAREIGATHILVVCDEFDGSYYVVYVMPEDNFNEKYRKYQDYNKMSSVMEVIKIEPIDEVKSIPEKENTRPFHMELRPRKQVNYKN